jgi:hypothetical protein
MSRRELVEKASNPAVIVPAGQVSTLAIRIHNVIKHCSGGVATGSVSQTCFFDQSLI